MYFPLLKPHGWGKRSAAQPKAICSEFPLCVLDDRPVQGFVSAPWQGQQRAVRQADLRFCDAPDVLQVNDQAPARAEEPVVQFLFKIIFI